MNKYEAGHVFLRNTKEQGNQPNYTQKAATMLATNNARLNEVALEGLVEYLTPTDEEVAEWNFLDVTLKVDRQRPLVHLLFWLVDDPRDSTAAAGNKDDCIDLRASLKAEPAHDIDAAELLPTAA